MQSTGITSALGLCCWDDGTRWNICVTWSTLWRGRNQWTYANGCLVFPRSGPTLNITLICPTFSPIFTKRQMVPLDMPTKMDYLRSHDLWHLCPHPSRKVHYWRPWAMGPYNYCEKGCLGLHEAWRTVLYCSHVASEERVSLYICIRPVDQKCVSYDGSAGLQSW